MTSHSDMAINNKGKIPWYLYFVGGMIYTALAGWAVRRIVAFGMDLHAQRSCGVFYAWRGRNHKTQHRDDA